MKKYLIRKVAEEGEDTKVSAKKFDAMLRGLIKSSPIPQKAVGGKKLRRSALPAAQKRSG